MWGNEITHRVEFGESAKDTKMRGGLEIPPEFDKTEWVYEIPSYSHWDNTKEDRVFDSVIAIYRARMHTPRIKSIIPKAVTTWENEVMGISELCGRRIENVCNIYYLVATRFVLKSIAF